MNTHELNSETSVLVVDDSAFMRAALTRMIESDPKLYVCGTAQTGMEALEQVAALKPDVVTLDVEMPGLNGLETLKRIVEESSVPVIMVSSLTREGAETTLEALHIGAFDYVLKQNSFLAVDTAKIAEELNSKIHAAAESRRRCPAGRVITAWRGLHFPAPSIVAVGISTGGPKALQEILPMLPPDLPMPIVIVQHMPKGFTKPLASRLSSLCRIKVKEAEQEERIDPGVVYIAPAGQHLTVHRTASFQAAIHLSIFPEKTNHMPSVDVMMLSVAEIYRSLAMGIIMTGMGCDGAQGMQAIFRAGGLTIGQDETSCAVYGMPRACAELEVLHRVVTLDQIPNQILQAIGYRKRA
jgi:two-component system, chemotaxis family, protein-glutamate methylesterase/glutaminase